ncbi:MAG: DUF501 domain-containing protein [Bacillota bacterium]|nr:DUF501 domain-containing protein [Bacillota bacterium]
MIKEQLGREPRGVLGVSSFCKHGHVQVIVNRPLSASGTELEIFPTLYWLTCPYLRKEIALLEGEGLIAEFEELIKEDSQFAEALKKNHEDYAKRRLSLIPSEVQGRLKEEYPERYQVLAESGVGGIRSPEGVKCLHTHVADYLVHGENVIGAKVIEKLNQSLACVEGQCGEFLG